MSERPREGGFTSGDPLRGDDPEPPRHESGLPGLPSEPETREREDGYYGYTSAPPPGALGPEAPAGAPAAGAGRYELSGWWRRVGAAVLDAVIIFAGAAGITALFAAVFSIGFFAGDTAGWLSIVAGLLLSFLAIAIVAIFYAPVMMARTNGQTLGRMVVGIRVIRANQQPMTFAWAMLREVVVKWLVFGIAGSFTMGLANLVDVLWPLWDDENRALHDMLVDTRVVRT